MNRILGVWSAFFVTISVVLFASLMLLRLDFGAYAMSMLISWCYLLLACSFSTAATDDRRVAAGAGVAFGTLYAGFVTTVYFIQLTTVLHRTGSPEVLAMLTYQELGSVMFNLDLLGYGMMAISTLFIGLTIAADTPMTKWLRFLMVLHGIFAPMCIALPILNIFGSMPRASGDATGIAVLLFWCLYFAPVGVLSFVYFRQTPNHGSRVAGKFTQPTGRR